MLVSGFELSFDCRRELSFGFQFCQEGLQGSAVELPLERAQLSIAQFLVQSQSLLDFLQAGEVVRRQHFPLDDRELDLHLIQPTGVHRRMNQNRLAISLPQSLCRRLAAVRGAIVHDPEDTAGGPVGLGPHNLLDQSTERVGPRIRLTPSQDAASADIPSHQVLQSSSSLVLVFHAQGTSWSGRQSRVTSDAGLAACPLIRADEVVPATQCFALPEAGIQVEDATGFLGEHRVAGEKACLRPRPV